MPSQPEIPFQFLSTQICTHCQLPVTCGPVYVINDLTILCGRCRMNAKDHYRNYAYEALASTFIYPCKNWRNHCPVSLRWNDSLDHERECNYQGCCTFCCVHPGAFCKSKREYPKDEIRLTLVPETFLEYLECVSCRGYLNSSPIFMQSNGQNLCHRCIYSNGNPPNCRRNVAYENFSQLFLFPCTNKNRGCNESLQFGLPIWKHESQCPYKPEVNRNNSSHQDVRSSIRLKSDSLDHTNINQNMPYRHSSRSNDPQRAIVHEYNDQRRSSVRSQENLDSRPNSRESIYQDGYFCNIYENEFGYPKVFRDNPGPGQFPVLMPHQLNDAFDSMKRTSIRNSSRINNMLISELRHRQDIIKRTHSIKGEKDVVNPFRHNLKDIKEAQEGQIR